MTGELAIIENPKELSRRTRTLKEKETNLRDSIIISKLGGGILRFAGAAFTGADLERVYAKKYEREPEGRGAHFDVYGSLLDSNFPWLALYNLSGSAKMSASVLPDDLADSYFRRFPNIEGVEEAAAKARREFSSIALNSPDLEEVHSVLNPDTGMVIVQKQQGLHMIHNIVPTDSNSPGEFVKLVVPKDNDDALSKIKKVDYVPLDELITGSLKSLEVINEEEETLPHEVGVSPRVRRVPTTIPHMPKRPCRGYD